MRSSESRSSTTSLARRHARTKARPAVRAWRSSAEPSRSTSGLVTSTSVMRLPVIARSRSRAMVSVSGSSGTGSLHLTLDLAPSDVGAILLPLEAHALDEFHAARLRQLHAWRDGADREHASAGRDELPLGVPRGTGVEDEDAVFGRRQRDHVTRARRLGIVGRGDDGRDARALRFDRRDARRRARPWYA